MGVDFEVDRVCSCVFFNNLKHLVIFIYLLHCPVSCQVELQDLCFSCKKLVYLNKE